MPHHCLFGDIVNTTSRIKSTGFRSSREKWGQPRQRNSPFVACGAGRREVLHHAAQPRVAAQTSDWDALWTSLREHCWPKDAPPTCLFGEIVNTASRMKSTGSEDPRERDHEARNPRQVQVQDV